MTFFLIDLALAALVLLSRVFWVPMRVKGRSMQPTLQDKEMLLMHRTRKLRRGDIVICHYPGRYAGKHKLLRQNFVKRVIGLPGETVRLEGDVLQINGVPLQEPYLELTRNSRALMPREWKLDAHSWFVMGDNRRASRDSRSVGPINEKLIVGRVCFVFFPFRSRRRFGTAEYTIRQLASEEDALHEATDTEKVFPDE